MNLLFANDQRGKYPTSYYGATATTLAEFPCLKGELHVDVCVVGGGYTGLSAALHLAQKGISVALLDAHRVGFGASGRNGGQAGSGLRLDQPDLENLVGISEARLLWKLDQEALTLTRDLIEKHAPDAGYKPGVAHCFWHPHEAQKAEKNAQYLLENYDYDQIETLDKNATQDLVHSPCYVGGEIDWGSGHLHPLRYALGLARAAASAGVKIFENSHVHHIQRGPKPTVQTGRGRVIASHVVLACNGYMQGLDRGVAARVMPINNFIVATEPLGEGMNDVLTRDVAVADSKFVVNYFRRSEDGRLLFGGGESYGLRYPADIEGKVRRTMSRVFPQLSNVGIDYAWGGTLAVTMSRLPYFARPDPNIFSASGYSGSGVAMAGLAGKVIAEAIAGHADRFEIFERVPAARFPGGPAFSKSLLVLGMGWYALRDKLGI